MQDLQKKNPLSLNILADDVKEGYDANSRLPNRISGYSTLKQNSMQFLDWAVDGGLNNLNTQDKKVLFNLAKCGSYLIFRNYTNRNITRLIGACSCKKHLLCAFCSSRRGVKNTVAYKAKYEQLLKENPDKKLLLITYTIKNGPDLAERFLHLQSSMRDLMQRRTNFLKRPTIRHCEFAKTTGGVFAYEFKRGSGSNDWHPHIHMLALVPAAEKLNYENLKTEWLDITGDSHVVNVQPVTDDSAFLEVFAYALKFSTLENSDRWFAYKTLSRQRLISSYGEFRGVEIDESTSDDLLAEDEPYIDLLFSYMYKLRKYDDGMIMLSSHQNFQLTA